MAARTDQVQLEHAKVPQTELLQPLRRKMEVFIDLDESEAGCIAGLERHRADFSRGERIIDEGDRHRDVYTIREGWCMMSRALPDGRRQVTNFCLPGDFLCFNAGLLERSSRDISALTDVRAYRIPPDDIMRLFARAPRLAVAFAWSNAQDESILAERLTSLGRRTAYERVAHLFVELWRRLELLDLTEGGRFLLPVTREQLADALGLSTLHLYRTLRKLQGDRLLDLRPGGVRILDMPGLETAAKFEESYLHYTEVPKQTERLLNRLKAVDNA